MPQEHDDDRDEPDIETAEKRTVLAEDRRSSRAATTAGKSTRAASRADAPGAQGRRGPAGTVRTVLATVVVIALIVVSVLLVLQTRTLGSERDAAADRARAEQIASDYAVKAATMDYRDLTPWLNGVKAGTTPELSKKFEGIADLMREVLTPLRLTSTGKASFAKTTSEVNGIYQVKVAVDVSSQNVQAPQGTVTTSTYSVTLDRNRSWVITEAGDPANPSAVLSGIGGASPSSSAAPSASPSVPATPAPSGTPN